MHKRTGEICAIKIVPVENDLDDLKKEINVMSGCDSSYIVKYHGSFLRESELWVCNDLRDIRRQ
jgi:serine/threonine kinase 3